MLTKEVLRRNPDFKPGQATEYRHYLIISIGTGPPSWPRSTRRRSAPSGDSSSGYTKVQWFHAHH
jgi:hypothetical protein